MGGWEGGGWWRKDLMAIEGWSGDEREREGRGREREREYFS